ncbi:diaminopimelate decarboxylase [Marivirga sericea]|uniref:diaminopimelate decarboxylase n=1 Tax=Marivirga sericea TaxID=1028 RepID=UPI000A1C8B13|nr:diaminopimelate decarboxylase [Marivirga sericea]
MENSVLTSLAKKYGTPLYVYDADKIASQINRLNDAFSGINLKLKYATKALSNVSVLKWMKKHGTGLDVVSIQEAYLGLKAGFEPKDILYTPNCVSIDEIVEAVDLGLMINIDNISILEQFGHRYHDSVPVCVRLNPHIMAGGNSKISTGHIDSKFGISILQMRHLLRVIDNYNLNVVGLHIHTGSDILDSEVFLRGTEIIFEAAEDFPNLDFIDFGSGFKVAYKNGDVTTDIEELGEEVSKRFKAFCKGRGKDLELWFEPGKFLVSESGYFLSKVNVIKTTPATVFVGLDTGMNHLLRPMMYDAYHQIENISNPSDTQRVYTVVGYICETDTFGTDRRLSEVRRGDIIAIKNAGAYGFSMASNYNSRYRPAEVLVHDGKDQLIRKRESLDDLLRNQVIVDFE